MPVDKLRDPVFTPKARFAAIQHARLYRASATWPGSHQISRPLKLEEGKLQARAVLVRQKPPDPAGLLGLVQV